MTLTRLLSLLLLWTCAQSSDGAEAPEERPPLAPLEDVGPILPAEDGDEGAAESAWKTVSFRPGESSDTITLRHGEEGFLVENATVQASARTALICYQGSGPFRGLTLRNCLVTVEPGTLPLDRSYWAVRGYDMIDTTLERVEITGFGKVTPKHDEGHAIYFNVAGPVSIVDCDVHHNGGQGLQLVNRPKESVLERGPAQGAVLVKHTSFRENGFNPDRGGFQVSIFGTGQTVRFEDVEILAGLDGTPFPENRTGGALLIEAEGFNPNRPEKPVWWRPDELPDDFEQPFSQGRTELLRVRVIHRSPDKPLVQIKGCEELIVRDGEFSGGDVHLDLPTKPGRDCGRIEWAGNRGDARVFVRGVLQGRASEDFVVEP